MGSSSFSFLNMELKIPGVSISINCLKSRFPIFITNRISFMKHYFFHHRETKFSTQKLTLKINKLSAAIS
ncbi:hypothetical protein DAQ1742_04106 [Dickeya aquatica]|uniref:Uncharacterized protein n=1 Tax=Dickeya aquatica TaxID=1401087 RepID=A0A375AFL6_9GAMM|nr:hypothetical protein DAQ1742_04106 [Dickeya aquatica]